MIKWQDQLFSTPDYSRAEHFEYSKEIKPVFYSCGTWKGRPVKAFAWLGLPELKPGETCPGIVLVHGGGGTAFADWVKLWNSRGYAAIAMDNCGGVPCWNECPHCRYLWPRHEFSGPAGWGDFVNVDLPPEDQWPYQATASVIAAHSLLRSLPQVDSSQIGITGISWGGVLTCMAAGIDNRFAFTAPVYGCGYLHLDHFTEYDLVKDIPGKGEKWSSMWDPSIYLEQAKMPFLWVNGTNDFAFPPDTMAKSIKTVKGKSSIALIVRMAHGHGGIGENPEEIHNFANIITGHAPALTSPEFSAITLTASQATVSCHTDWKIKRAELSFTTDSGIWKERLWQTVPAHSDNNCISAQLTGEVKACYFNAYSENGLTFSSELEIIG